MSERDDTGMTAAEFLAAKDAGVPCEVVRSREEYLARMREFAEFDTTEAEFDSMMLDAEPATLDPGSDS